MDPALWELLTGEEADREVEAIIRLRDVDQAVPGVRLVARFGRIATCRVRSASIVDVRGHPNVVSLKAPRKLDADHAGVPAADVDMSIRRDLRPTDSRRPPQDALTGAGVVVGVVDWGLDFDHPNFKYPDGTTRLLALWDQRDVASGDPPRPYGYGTVHSRNQINRALRTAQPYISLGYHPGSADRGFGAHGTHVADIAVGNGSAGGPHGVAPDAHLVFVHLADRNTGGLANLGDSVRLLEAVDFIARMAEPRPWVINISIGRHGGPHDGTTLAELAFDELLRAAPGRFIVQSTGNYYLSRTHASGKLTRGRVHTLTFLTSPKDNTENELEIWYDGDDEFVVHIRPPGSPAAISVPLRHHARLTAGDQTVGRIYHRAGDPNNNDNHIDAFLYPQGRAGRWTVTLEAVRLVNGRFNAWLERDEACKQCQARFTSPDSDPTSTTGTIANSQLPLVVGAYDGHSRSREVAAFTSSGPTRDARIKPDLVAPGVDVLAARSAAPGSPRSSAHLVRKSGSSMAAPHVTGAGALCLQAGGHRLRAEQLRALVLATARPAATIEDALRLGGGYLDLAALVTDVLRRFPGQIPHDRTRGTPMDTELDPIARLALAPSRAYRELMYRPHGATAQWIADRFDIVARPGQQITDRPRQGDVLLRVSLGHPNSGVCAVIDQSDTGQRRMAPGQLLLRRRRAIREGPPAIEHDFGDETDAETRTPVVVDPAAAVPAFEMTERSRIAEPLLTPRESASAVEWTTRVHPAISGVTVGEIRAALATYTDATAVHSAIQARNQQDPAQAVDASSSTTDAVFVECVHQFQMKCYLESREHDGRAGESTLDSLGLIARQGSGLRTADRGDATAQQRLNSRDTQLKEASAQEFSAANWFNLMTDPSVFGLRTKGGRGLHVALVRKLRRAERHLITLPALRGMTPAALGTALGLSEKHGGARHDATTSVHTFGLAIDVGYLRNPWVRRAASWRAMQRAASLISGVNLTHGSAPAYFSSLGSDPSRSTGEVWDEIQQRNAELIAYLGFAADPQALRAALTAGQARGTPSLINEGENPDAAVVRWQRDIDQDRRALTAGDFKDRRPERGFLTHPRDLAIALRDHGCLAWGAVDLGPGDRGSGDMMHYDARIDGVGRVLTQRTRAFLPATGHPCLSSMASGGAENAALDAETIPEQVRRGGLDYEAVEAEAFGEDADSAQTFGHLWIDWRAAFGHELESEGSEALGDWRPGEEIAPEATYSPDEALDQDGPPDPPKVTQSFDRQALRELPDVLRARPLVSLSMKVATERIIWMIKPSLSNRGAEPGWADRLMIDLKDLPKVARVANLHVDWFETAPFHLTEQDKLKAFHRYCIKAYGRTAEPLHDVLTVGTFEGHQKVENEFGLEPNSLTQAAGLPTQMHPNEAANFKMIIYALLPPDVGAVIGPRDHRILFRFPFAKATLTAEHDPILDSLAREVVRSWYSRGIVTRIVAQGHTDRVGSRQYNYELGRRRAEAVVSRLKKLIIQYGGSLPAGTVDRIDYVVKTFGKDRAFSKQVHALNRRVELTLHRTNILSQTPLRLDATASRLAQLLGSENRLSKESVKRLQCLLDKVQMLGVDDRYANDTQVFFINRDNKFPTPETWNRVLNHVLDPGRFGHDISDEVVIQNLAKLDEDIASGIMKMNQIQAYAGGVPHELGLAALSQAFKQFNAWVIERLRDSKSIYSCYADLFL